MMMTSNQNKSFKTKLKSIKKELISTTNTLTRSKSVSTSSSSSSSSTTTAYPCSMASLSSPYSSLQSSPYSSTNTSPRSVVSATFTSSSLAQSTPELAQEQHQQHHHQHSSSSSFRYRSQSISQSFSKLTQNLNHSNKTKAASHFHLPAVYNQQQRQLSNSSSSCSPSPYESTFDTCIPLDSDHFTYTNITSPKVEPEDNDNLDLYRNYNDAIDSTDKGNHRDDVAPSSSSGMIKEEITIPPLPDINEFNTRYQQRQQLQLQRQQSNASSTMFTIPTTGNNSSTSLHKYNTAISRDGSLKSTTNGGGVLLNQGTGNFTPSTSVSLAHSKTNSVDNSCYYDDGGVKEISEEQQEDYLAINILNSINKSEIAWDI
ncbi:hypothetical protein I9W82_001684 [Candida metapsilosis]|uniref:Uncharacterized protein n=1 Tax=Candida metapsilosis TaxID=273372 RepID=A0A8H7ZGQ2_9ASCO|nr:hypothetical protein I9W82_001684 [Candida metapsilosis]